MSIAGRLRRALGDGWATLSGAADRAALARAEGEARTAEARLREALDVLPEGIVLLDPEGRYILWNRRYAEIYHRSADLFREGAKLADTLRIGVARGDYPQAVGQEEIWLSQRLAALDNPDEPHEQQLADGRWIRIEERKTADGGNIGLRVDITDLKSQSAALEAALERAETAGRARSEFLARVSHELRTPLNGVIGMADILARSSLTGEQTEALAHLRASSARLEDLISDLLDFNTLEAGQSDLKSEPFALGDLVRETVAAFGPDLAALSLALSVEVAPAAEDAVLGDPGRVRQILANLISNALKFTEAGRVAVALDADRTETGKCYRLSVRDTGPGFDPLEAERLFDGFGQADAGATTRHGGIGLGLAICFRLCQRMGGSIRAEGVKGRGAVFTVTLPLPPAPETACPALRPLAVLLADDNETNRRVVEMMLGAVGADVVSVENGALAVDAMRTRAFDAVLMDLRMPVMDGLTAIRQIRAWETAAGTGRVPIIVLSANAADEDRADSIRAGADGHLGKPIQVEPLLQALSRAVEVGPSEPRNPETQAA